MREPHPPFNFYSDKFILFNQVKVKTSNGLPETYLKLTLPEILKANSTAYKTLKT